MVQNVHLWRACAAVLAVLMTFSVLPVQAQVADDAPADSKTVQGSGTAVLTDWPDGWPSAAVRGGADVLPALDTLALGYRYEADPEAPQMAFTVRWIPASHGYDRGRRVTVQALPDLRMTMLALEADVMIQERRVAGVVIAIDSMALRVQPDSFAFEAADLSYATVFAGTSADSARAYFERGFSLENLTVRRIGFEPVQAERRVANRRSRRDAPGPVYVPRPAIDIGIGWVIRPRTRASGGGSAPPSDGRTPGTRRAGDDEDGRSTGRGDDRARGDRGEDDRKGSEDGAKKRGRRKNSDDDDRDDDDDDKESLRPAAAVAAAAVGAVALGGGSVGYYGTTEAPFGVTAGYADPRGGALLQASVNGALLLGEEGEAQRLTAKALVFYDVLGAPVQPALSLGVRARADDEIDLDPSLALGAALNLGRVVVLGGYDVLGAAAEFGVAINFRAKP